MRPLVAEPVGDAAVGFAGAVAIGAIFGRTALASGQSFIFGAVALLTFLAAHTLTVLGRFDRRVAKFVDHRSRVLVDHGHVRSRQLRIGGLTDSDLVSQLRRRGIHNLEDLRYVLYETSGVLSLVREDDPKGELVAIGIRDATGFDVTKR